MIIPTYKRSSWLDRAIKSVLNQTYKNVEVVVVDDNPPDSKYREDTAHLMLSYESDNRVIYLKNDFNQGGAISRNNGVEVASGEYITFLDDDDVYKIDKIKKQLEFYEEKMILNKNLGFVYCQMNVFNNDVLTRKTRNYFDGNEVPYKENLKGCIAGTPTIFIKKNTFLQIGGFKNLKSGQDWYLIQETLFLGFSIFSMKESLVDIYEHRLDRISNSNGKVDSLKNELLILKYNYLSVDFIDQHEKKKILFFHYYQIASALKFNNKIESLKYIFKANSYFFSLKLNAKFFISILLGENISKVIRKVL